MNTFALPDETRISQVNLRTPNLDRALGFYESTLGLRVVQRDAKGAGLSAGGPGPPFIILTADAEAAPHPARATGLYHTAIRYPARQNLARALQRLARAGHPLEGASDHLVSEALYLSDADGNGVELYTDRPRSEWKWRNGSVNMSTEPLDLDDLMATIPPGAEDVDAPPGTDLGHIHLHVADLAGAERFYSEFLGLAVTQRDYPGALFMSAGGYHHHIAVNTWAGKSPAPPRSAGLISYRLSVPLAEVLYCLEHRAPLKGYEARMAPTEPGGPMLQIRDPNGHWLEIQAPAGRG